MKKRILLAVWVAWVPAAAAQASETHVPATDAEREQFLLDARVVRMKGAPGGTTGSYRATLRLGDVEHDAHIQPHDEFRSEMALASTVEIDFRDTWRNNVAAYRIDRMLGLGMVPVTVVRRDPQSRRLASFTWWVDDVLMDELARYERKLKAPDVVAWNRQIYIVRIFDQLIYNFDRNLGNLLIDRGWNVWMIDHTRGFKIFKELRSEKNLPETCEADLYAQLRTLAKPQLQQAMKELLGEGQVDALLGRRDRILQIYEQKIAQRGEEQVLYHLPSRRVAGEALASAASAAAH
jgi:hypothetical protein